MEALSATMYATTFTFLMTTLGATAVLISKKPPSAFFSKISLGFAAGIMIAASMWSLLMPAIEQVESEGKTAALPVAGGFIAGALFLMALDKLMPHLHLNSKEPEGPKSNLSKQNLLFLAITIHNIPEGMAVGAVFAGVLAQNTPLTMAGAFALSIGIAIQNFPEGAIISLPLRGERGMSRSKAFLCGTLSGIVEPIAGLLTIALSAFMTPLLPYSLSFAAGAMMYVVAEELIPEAASDTKSNIGTIGLSLGFVLMMMLDVTLG